MKQRAIVKPLRWLRFKDAAVNPNGTFSVPRRSTPPPYQPDSVTVR
jgi:hypothetical protein